MNKLYIKMNNEKLNQIINGIWKEYGKSHWTPPENPNSKLLAPQLWSVKPMQHNKDTFINEIKTNPFFAKKWGLKIEERELSLDERYKLANINGTKEKLTGEPTYIEEQQHSMLDDLVPAKLITITYNGEKIEVYE